MKSKSLANPRVTNPRVKAWLTALGGVATAAAVLAGGAPASAEEILVESPANWRLQNYVSNNVVIWFTGAQAQGCTSGQLTFPGATSDDLNRLWSTVLAAKLGNRSVGVTYNKNGGSCQMTSFWIEG